jgi:hypothetical protein
MGLSRRRARASDAAAQVRRPYEEAKEKFRVNHDNMCLKREQQETHIET